MLQVARLARADDHERVEREARENAIIARLDALIAVQQRVLDKLDDAFGMPHSNPYTIKVLTTVANQVYGGEKLPMTVMFDYLNLSSSTATSVSLYALSDHYPNGQQVLGYIYLTASQSTVSLDNFRFRIPAGGQLAVSVDHIVGNLYVFGSYHQIDAYPSDYWRGRS